MKQNDGKKLCKIEVGFNELGMLIFDCKTHGNPKDIYKRLGKICMERLSKKLEKIVKILLDSK